MAAKVEVYSSMWCPFCYRAKKLLSDKGVAFEEIDVDGDPKVRESMRERSGGRYTVPQIFINGVGVGGSDDLAALERAGKLDAMLASNAAAG
ncbi:MAG: glutaredoxin 3 [Alphaproteobacteria bacterium]